MTLSAMSSNKTTQFTTPSGASRSLETTVNQSTAQHSSDSHSQKNNKGQDTVVNYSSNIGSAMCRREWRFFKQRHERSLFVRNLPFHFRDEHLRNLIVELLGGREDEVELCRVKYSSEHGKTLQVGVVMLRGEQTATDVLVRLQANPRHGGRDIRAGHFDATAATEQSHDGTVQFSFKINCVEPLITEAVVREHFEAEFGALQTINIRGHFFKPNMQEGYGFMSCMSSCKDAELSEGATIKRSGVTYTFKGINGNGNKGQQSQDRLINKQSLPGNTNNQHQMQPQVPSSATGLNPPHKMPHVTPPTQEPPPCHYPNQQSGQQQTYTIDHPLPQDARYNGYDTRVQMHQQHHSSPHPGPTTGHHSPLPLSLSPVPPPQRPPPPAVPALYHPPPLLVDSSIAYAASTPPAGYGQPHPYSDPSARVSMPSMPYYHHHHHLSLDRYPPGLRMPSTPLLFPNPVAGESYPGYPMVTLESPRNYVDEGRPPLYVEHFQSRELHPYTPIYGHDLTQLPPSGQQVVYGHQPHHQQEVHHYQHQHQQTYYQHSPRIEDSNSVPIHYQQQHQYHQQQHHHQFH